MDENTNKPAAESVDGRIDQRPGQPVDQRADHLAGEPSGAGQHMAEQVGADARRRLHARRSPPAVWLGLGMAGAIGWSVALPALVGVALGGWLDHHYPGARSWTLALLVAGLTLGCFNAWRWIERQRDNMLADQPEPKENHDEPTAT